MGKEMLIQSRDLGIRAGNKFILKNIDWEIYQGEHWVVFGRNGSGKTTLLSAIAGYTSYTHGILKVFGKQYDATNIFDIRKKIGWISSSFFDKCLTRETVIEIVLSGKYGSLGVDFSILDEDVRRAKWILEELGLKFKQSYPFDILSKGERQNVLIARSLMSSPDILILDEPCTGLDVFYREYLLSTLRDLASNTNITIIFVTHYPEEICDIFSNALLIKNGLVYKIGKTAEVFTSEIMTDFFNYPIDVYKKNNATLFK